MNNDLQSLSRSFWTAVTLQESWNVFPIHSPLIGNSLQAHWIAVTRDFYHDLTTLIETIGRSDSKAFFVLLPLRPRDAHLSLLVILS